MSKDTTFVRKGELMPRNKHGDKKGYYPERSLVKLDGRGEPIAPSRGKDRRKTGSVSSVVNGDGGTTGIANYDPWPLQSFHHKWETKFEKPVSHGAAVGRKGRVSWQEGKEVTYGLPMRRK